MSLIIIAGIPDLLKQEFSQVRNREIERGTRKVIWSPLSGPLHYSDDYITKLYNKFSSAIFRTLDDDSGRQHSPINATAILICIAHPGSNWERVLEAFFPETLPVLVSIPQLPNLRAPPNKIRAANRQMIGKLIRAMTTSERALTAIKKEVTSRDNNELVPPCWTVWRLV